MPAWPRMFCAQSPNTLHGMYRNCAYLVAVCCLCFMAYTLVKTGARLVRLHTQPRECDHIGRGQAEIDDYSMRCKERFLEKLKTRTDFDSLFYNTSIEEELASARMGTPLQPLNNFRSPCWVSEGAAGWRLRCVPAVYLMGFAKSGTSDIHSALCRHPAVFRGRCKEYHYWDFRRLASWGEPVIPETFSQYADDFRSSMDSLLALDNDSKERCPPNNSMCVHIDSNQYYSGIVVDGTPSYMHMYAGWERIPANRGLQEPKVTLAHTLHTLYPGTKFIVTLRHPIDRAYSNFRHFVKFEPPEVFHDVMMTSIKLWNDCLNRHSVRACAFNYSLIPCDSLYKCGVYIRASLYPVYLKEWLDVFPRRQIHLVKAEEYFSDRRPTTGALLSFLGLPDLSESQLASLASTQVHNSRDRKQASKQPMLNSTWDQLHSFFTPYIRELAGLLGERTFTWDFDV